MTMNVNSNSNWFPQTPPMTRSKRSDKFKSNESNSGGSLTGSGRPQRAKRAPAPPPKNMDDYQVTPHKRSYRRRDRQDQQSNASFRSDIDGTNATDEDDSGLPNLLLEGNQSAPSSTMASSPIVVSPPQSQLMPNDYKKVLDAFNNLDETLLMHVLGYSVFKDNLYNIEKTIEVVKQNQQELVLPLLQNKDSVATPSRQTWTPAITYEVNSSSNQ